MTSNPRPVRSASRWLGAAAALAGIIPTIAAEFQLWDWTAGQVNAYTLAVGTIIGAVSLVLGVQVEKVVTPTSRPRDDAGRYLTPGPLGGSEGNTPPGI